MNCSVAHAQRTSTPFDLAAFADALRARAPPAPTIVRAGRLASRLELTCRARKRQTRRDVLPSDVGGLDEQWRELYISVVEPLLDW